jgi:ribosome-binding factor A
VEKRRRAELTALLLNSSTSRRVFTCPFTDIAQIVSGELKDPRIGFATVTGVDLSPDLHLARVSVSVLGSAEEQQKSFEGLVSATGYVRHELGVRLGLRRTPELAFVLDQSAEIDAKLETLLDKLKHGP